MTGSELRPPRWHTAPDWSITLGPEVAALCDQVGFGPYPEQRLVLDDLFAIDPQHPERSAEFEQTVIAGRQQLKTGSIKQAVLGWLFVCDVDKVIWSAQRFDTVVDGFNAMKQLIESAPVLSKRLERCVGGGRPHIDLVSGATVEFKTRTMSNARGLAGDKVVIDEAYDLGASEMGALLPTLISKPDPQVLYASSAGLAKSEELRRIRDRCRPGAYRAGYAEWAAERATCEDPSCNHAPGTPGCALDRIDLWRQSCPVTARRDPERMEIIANLRRQLTPDEFMREILCWWDEPVGTSEINAEMWGEKSDGKIAAPSIAFDVAPDLSWSSIVAAGPDGARTRIEITSRAGEWDHRQGTAWLVPRLVELRHTLPGMVPVFAGGSSAESLIPELEQAGFAPVRISRRDVTAACARFLDLAHQHLLAHLGQDELTAAVLAARKHTIGEGAFIWTRRGVLTDLTPLYAATLAVWASLTQKDPAMNVW